jgi:uncharacterized protein (TIGR00369 family)
LAAEDLQKVKEDFENSSFWKFIGLQLKEMKEGYISLALPLQNDFINVRNSVHGGIYASILDTTMGMTARTAGFDEVATLHLNIQYLKSVVDGMVYSESAIIHQSRNTLLVEGKLMDETGELLAHCTGTFKVSKGKSAS